MSLNVLLKHYMDTAQYSLAYTMYKQVLHETRKDFRLVFDCVFLLIQLSKYDEAWQVSAVASEEDWTKSANPQLYQLLKLKANKLSSYEEAKHCAMVLAVSDTPKEADGAFQYAMSCRPPEDGALVVEYATYCLNTGNNSKALDLARQALGISDDSAQAWLVYSSILRETGDLPLAQQAADKAAELAPNMLEAWISKTAIEMCLAATDADALHCVASSKTALNLLINQLYSVENVETVYCKIKHDYQQAHYLKQTLSIDWADDFLSVCGPLVEKLEADQQATDLLLSEHETTVIKNYNKIVYIPELIESDEPCLNPDLDWEGICNQYFSASPNLVVIDHFLTPAALNNLRRFCYEAKVWHTSYQYAYLGAFADRGFLSPTHLKISRELKLKLARILDQQQLEQLWAFKYDSVLGKGINVHADFARVNLNFWITPDEYHLNKGRGGMVVYSEPAPKTWGFNDYNVNAQKIYDFLNQNHARGIGVPYQCNRAVLFDSALFHETDDIHFADHYLGRRINMTYLYGSQLKYF